MSTTELLYRTAGVSKIQIIIATLASYITHTLYQEFQNK
jgi:hypothetical protein